MVVTADTVIRAAALLAAVSALIGAIIAVYKVYDNNKKQNECNYQSGIYLH